MMNMVAATTAENQNLSESARISSATEVLWYEQISDLVLGRLYLMRSLTPKALTEICVGDFLLVVTAGTANADISTIISRPMAIFEVTPYYEPTPGDGSPELLLKPVARLENANSALTKVPSDALIVAVKTPRPSRFLVFRSCQFRRDLEQTLAIQGKQTVGGEDEGGAAIEKPINKTHYILDLDKEQFIDHDRASIQEKMRATTMVRRLLDQKRADFLVIDNKIDESRMTVLKGHCTSEGQSLSVGGLAQAFPKIEDLSQIRESRIFREVGLLKSFFFSGKYRNYELSAAEDKLGSVSLTDFTSADMHALVSDSVPTDVGRSAIASALYGLQIVLEVFSGTNLRDSHLAQIIADLRSGRVWKKAIDLYIVAVIEIRMFAWVTTIATVAIDLVPGYVQPTATSSKGQSWLSILDDMLKGGQAELTVRPHVDFSDSTLRVNLIASRRKVKVPVAKSEGADEGKGNGNGNGNGNSNGKVKGSGKGGGKGGGKGSVGGGEIGGGDGKLDGNGNSPNDTRRYPMCLAYLAQQMKIPKYVESGCTVPSCKFTHKFDKGEMPKADWIKMVSSNHSQNELLKASLVSAFQNDTDK
jgi:hypothetical protein